MHFAGAGRFKAGGWSAQLQNDRQLACMIGDQSIVANSRSRAHLPFECGRSWTASLKNPAGTAVCIGADEDARSVFMLLVRTQLARTQQPQTTPVFPSDMSVSPRSVARRDQKLSGRRVPHAVIVRSTSLGQAIRLATLLDVAHAIHVDHILSNAFRWQR